MDLGLAGKTALIAASSTRLGKEPGRTDPCSTSRFANVANTNVANIVTRAPSRASASVEARVLDVARSTGVVSRAAAILAGTGGSVACVDLGEPTVAIARSHPAEENATPIDYAQADAAALPFDADDFDVALCQQGLQFFPERAAALAEMRRVLKPGGRVAVATWKDIRSRGGRLVAEAWQPPHPSLRNARLSRRTPGAGQRPEGEHASEAPDHPAGVRLLTFWRQNPESFGLLPLDVWRGTVMPVHSFHMAMQDVYLAAREPWTQQMDRVYEQAVTMLDHMIEPLQQFAC
jgi:SAM-dependent methyltransferase